MQNKRTRELKWFIDTLQSEFSTEVKVNEIGVEATELGLDEVEDFFVPSELFDALPEILVYEITIVDDEQNNVWLVQLPFFQIVPNGACKS